MELKERLSLLNKGDIVGVSDWVEITQEQVTTFAVLSGDEQWIHTDINRASNELPGGKTLVHGLLILGKFPYWLRSMNLQLPLPQPRQLLNYGYNKVRFIAPVQTGSRIRTTVKLINIVPKDNGFNIIFEFTVEVEGRSGPAVIAEYISRWII